MNLAATTANLDWVLLTIGFAYFAVGIFGAVMIFAESKDEKNPTPWWMTITMIAATQAGVVLMMLGQPKWSGLAILIVQPGLPLMYVGLGRFMRTLEENPNTLPWIQISMQLLVFGAGVGVMALGLSV